MPIRKLGSGQEVPFYDFAPDSNLTTPGIILDAQNAMPTIKGYKTRNSAVQVAPALPLTGTVRLGVVELVCRPLTSKR